MNNPPNPWGSCFDATAHNLIGNMEEDVWVCHGIGIANRPGQEGMRIAHAWLEFKHEGQIVALDCVWLMFQKASVYREKLQLTYAIKYSKEEFMRLWTLHDFPGPWDPLVKGFTSEALHKSAQ